MSRGDLDAVWDVINDVRKDVSAIDKRLVSVESESKHCKEKQSQTDSKIADMCAQLKSTETALRKEMKEGNEEVKNEVKSQGQLISADLKILMDSHLLRKGAESAAIGIAKFAPKTILTILALAFLSGIYWMSKQ